MKRPILILIFFYSLCIVPSIRAQKMDYGVFIGGNYNMIYQRSDYEIKDENDLKPALSYNLGGYIKTNYRKINLLGSIEYSKIRSKFNQTFIDPSGNYVRESESSINNHCIIINAMGTIKIVKGLYVGAGLSGSYLIRSSLKVEGDLYKYKLIGSGFIYGDKIENVYTNHNFKTIMFSVPVIIGYDIKRLNFFTRFNIGVMNRLKGDSFVKEIENSLVFGIGYRLTKYK